MTPTPAQIEAVIDEFKDELTSGQRRLIVNEICRLTAAAEVDMATGDIPKGYKGKWTSTQAQIEAAAFAVLKLAQHFNPNQPPISESRCRMYAEAALTAAAEVGEPATLDKWRHDLNVINATIERCAQVADKYATGDDLASDIAREIANEQRALKDK